MKRGRMLSRSMRDKLFSSFLTSPAIIMATVSILVPVVDSVIKSSTKHQIKDITSGKPGTWNNFQNYIKLLQNVEPPRIISNTFIFAIVVVPSAFIPGMALSLASDSNAKGAKIIQGVMVTPWVIPMIILVLIWMWLFQPQHGLVKYLISAFGSEAVTNLTVLNSPKTALTGVSIAVLWKQISLMILLLLTGFQNVPEELLEAATVDGANRVQKFLHITMPSMRSVINIAVPMLITEDFEQLPLFWIMTGGGPDGIATTLVILGYREVLVSQDLGSGMAVTIAWTLLMIGITFIYNKPSKKSGD